MGWGSAKAAGTVANVPRPHTTEQRNTRNARKPTRHVYRTLGRDRMVAYTTHRALTTDGAMEILQEAAVVVRAGNRPRCTLE